MSIKHKGEDFNSVFRRADENMYVNKKELKDLRPDYNVR